MTDFCKDCFTGSILPGEPQGEIVQIGGLSTYVATPRESAVREDVVLVYAADAFGLGLVNNKILPDLLANALGCRVYVPDLLQGDYPPMQSTHPFQEPIGHKSYLYQALEYVKLLWTFLWHVGPRWFLSHRRSVVSELTTTFIRNLRAEKNPKRVGIIGYCLGGVQAVSVAGSSDNLVDVAVVAHPGLLNKTDFERVRVPISFICSEEDFTFTTSIKRQAQDIIGKKNDIPSEFITYKGTTHGFAARPDLSNALVKDGFQGAFEQGVRWFKAYLL